MIVVNLISFSHGHSLFGSRDIASPFWERMGGAFLCIAGKWWSGTSMGKQGSICQIAKRLSSQFRGGHDFQRTSIAPSSQIDFATSKKLSIFVTRKFAVVGNSFIWIT